VGQEAAELDRLMAILGRRCTQKVRLRRIAASNLSPTQASRLSPNRPSSASTIRIAPCVRLIGAWIKSNKSLAGRFELV
jgi:hypothetical protein